MLTPTNGLPAFTISDLDPTQTPATTLAGALIETEILTAPGQYKNTKTTTEQLAEYLGTLLGTGTGFSITQLPNGDFQANPALAAYLDAGGDFYWMSPNAQGQRQQVNAGTSPSNTPAQNSQALTSMAQGLSQP